jgi:hypothetical protein
MADEQNQPACAPPDWSLGMAYGGFTDPENGFHFFFVRVPEGRQPWTKKVFPAIDRTVRALYSKKEIKRHFELIRDGREGTVWWKFEALEPEVWFLKKPVTRYEWTAEGLVKVAAPGLIGTETPKP